MEAAVGWAKAHSLRETELNACACAVPTRRDVTRQRCSAEWSARALPDPRICPPYGAPDSSRSNSVPVPSLDHYGHAAPLSIQAWTSSPSRSWVPGAGADEWHQRQEATDERDDPTAHPNRPRIAAAEQRRMRRKIRAATRFLGAVSPRVFAHCPLVWTARNRASITPALSSARHAGGRGAQVAQLVEHCTENAGVGGSNPPLGTTTFAERERRRRIAFSAAP